MRRELCGTQSTRHCGHINYYVRSQVPFEMKEKQHASVNLFKVARRRWISSLTAFIRRQLTEWQNCLEQHTGPCKKMGIVENFSGVYFASILAERWCTMEVGTWRSLRWLVTRHSLGGSNSWLISSGERVYRIYASNSTRTLHVKFKSNWPKSTINHSFCYETRSMVQFLTPLGRTGRWFSL